MYSVLVCWGLRDYKGIIVFIVTIRWFIVLSCFRVIVKGGRFTCQKVTHATWGVGRWFKVRLVTLKLPYLAIYSQLCYQF